MPESYQDILEKYRQKLKEELGGEARANPTIISKEYGEFKEELMPRHYSWYEKSCNLSERILKLSSDPKTTENLQKHLSVCHLNATPSGVVSFSALSAILFLLLGLLMGINPLLTTVLKEWDATKIPLPNSWFFAFFFFASGMAIYFSLQKLPEFMANSWRMKSSNQMVQCIFYVVTYMRHTSNLERAVEFASDHLSPPLSIDLKKVLWDVETSKYSNIKDSLNAYLDGWKEWNGEFIEAFHLIESSLYEPSESQRLALLDKSLDVILSETYEKMLHYAHGLQSPITMLHMLGVILPILGLVILPLVVSFLTGGGEGQAPTHPLVMAGYIALLYNIILPVTVFFMGKAILSQRPTGYGDSDISEDNPELKRYRNGIIHLGKTEILINPLAVALMLGFVFLIIGLSPIIIHQLNPSWEFSWGGENSNNFDAVGYICPPGIACDAANKVGPFGMGAALISLVAVLGFGLALGSYYSLRSSNVINIRENTKKLEEEFATALFQFGNRLGDGIPAEMAVIKVAENMEGTTSGNFFRVAQRNMLKLGMSLQQAIFDSKVGALIYFPSKIIESSMKILVDSVKKGPRIAAEALLSVSRYIQEIHRVNERLKDLMAEIISSMTSQIKFLTPAIAGIVIGITSMITTILTKLAAQMSAMTEGGTGGLGGMGNLVNMFGTGMPTYYFQFVVGIYVIQITFILTIIASGIENGEDKLMERYLLGKNIIRSTFLYVFISAIVIVLFNLFAIRILPT